MGCNDIEIRKSESVAKSQFLFCDFRKNVENKNKFKKKTTFLETSWTEHILVTPIRSNMFPHSAMPPAKLKSQGY